jgi:hypothetical protein
MRYEAIADRLSSVTSPKFLYRKWSKILTLFVKCSQKSFVTLLYYFITGQNTCTKKKYLTLKTIKHIFCFGSEIITFD